MYINYKESIKMCNLTSYFSVVFFNKIITFSSTFTLFALLSLWQGSLKDRNTHELVVTQKTLNFVKQ